MQIVPQIYSRTVRSTKKKIKKNSPSTTSGSLPMAPFIPHHPPHERTLSPHRQPPNIGPAIFALHETHIIYHTFPHIKGCCNIHYHHHHHYPALRAILHPHGRSEQPHHFAPSVHAFPVASPGNIVEGFGARVRCEYLVFDPPHFPPPHDQKVSFGLRLLGGSW